MTLSSGVVALVAISVSAAVVSLMSPDGEIKKYINLVSVLAVVASLAVPVASALGNVPDIVARFEEIDFDNGAAGGFDAVELSRAQIEKSTAEQIETNFGFERGSVDVDVVLDKSDVSSIGIISVTAGVPRGADTEKVRAFLREIYKNTAEVAIYEVDDE